MSDWVSGSHWVPSLSDRSQSECLFLVSLLLDLDYVVLHPQPDLGIKAIQKGKIFLVRQDSNLDVLCDSQTLKPCR